MNDYDTIIPRESNWFAVYTKSRHEKKVAERMELDGIEYYLPIQVVVKKWSDRKKKVEEPVFKSYIFVHIGLMEYEPVLQIDGVVAFVRFSGKPEIIPDNQIESVKLILESDYELEIDSETYTKGDVVEVIYGSLLGVVGELTEIRGKTKLVVHVEALGKNMSVQIPRKYVRKLKSSEIENKMSKLQKRFLS